MKYFELLNQKRFFFGYEDIARTLKISNPAAKVTAGRYVRMGLLIRLKRNMYILKEKWNSLEQEQKFIIANYLQTPSYISLMTALDYFEITTQIQQDFLESVALKRTKRIEIESTIFNFTRIDRELYGGFVKRNDFFIALPEKAFLDALYLTSLGRYTMDWSAIDFDKFNQATLRKLVKNFPLKTINLIQKHEYFRET